jgi:hypothetical protein
MNAGDLVLVNGPDQNGVQYNNQSGILMRMVNNICVVKFITQNANLGIIHPLYGCNCAEFSRIYVRRVDVNEIQGILQMRPESLNFRMERIRSMINYSVNNLQPRDFVLVNGVSDNGRRYNNEPAIILRTSGNGHMGILVQFIRPDIGNHHPIFGQNTANFRDYRRFILSDLFEFNFLLFRSLDADAVAETVNNIFIVLNQHLDAEEAARRIVGGLRRKSLKKRISNRKRKSKQY